MFRPGAPPDGHVDSMVAALLAAPAWFRSVLKLLQTKSDASELISKLSEAALLEEEGQTLCTMDEQCACRAIATEVGTLGGEFAALGVRHVHTNAQAAFFLQRSRAWIRARERLSLSSADVGSPFEQHAYASYDTERYDFRGTVLRMLAEQLDDTADDPIAMLHTSHTGRAELGFLQSARRWAATGDLEYSKSLDTATRYGCGSFHRAWKRSSLRDDFLGTYEHFVSEVIAPLLGCPHGLVYQAVPVFRVFMPGHLGVGPRHTDSSYHEQSNELNFWVPLSAAHGANSLQLESRPGAADFEPIDCGYGQFLRFRGNACEHYTEFNVSERTRAWPPLACGAPPLCCLPTIAHRARTCRRLL